MATREQIVKQAEKWIGCKESNGSHKKIIDLYNSHKPLARNYKVKYTDSWCATTVSAVAIACGATDIIPTECSCQKQIELFKAKGCWRENENYTPQPGDIIYYDWQDGGSGDNKGWSDHVGIVQKVVGKTIYIIEGNYSNAVKVRKIAVNGRYIRGYGLPKYQASAHYKVKITAFFLNVRAGAGTGYKIKQTVKRNEVFTIVEEKNGWGKLLSGAGWISLKYTKRV